jgi:hypothetical protein
MSHDMDAHLEEWIYMRRERSLQALRKTLKLLLGNNLGRKIEDLMDKLIIWPGQRKRANALQRQQVDGNAVNQSFVPARPENENIFKPKG